MTAVLLRFAPYLLAALLAFGTGWRVNGWRLTSSYEKERAQAQQLESQRLRFYAAELERTQKEDRKLAARHQDKVAALNARINQLRRERDANAEKDTGTGETPFTVGFVRDANRMRDAANGELPGGEAPAAGAPGAAADTGATSTLTRGQLLDWIAEVTKLYGKCRQQVLGVKEWDAQP